MNEEKIIELKKLVIQHFTEEHWHEVGLITSCSNDIRNHNRLLRSLRWNDSDYPACVLDILQIINSRKKENISKIIEYVEKTFTPNVEYISHTNSDKKIIFSPNVFKVPDVEQNENLISVMMPFGTDFDRVYEAIKNACSSYEVKRADEIWVDSTIIQDIFSLIFTSKYVIADITGANPNVFYEIGIAHTLGKCVIPISQMSDTFPFDLRHHRCLKYHNNDQGRFELIKKLQEKLRDIMIPLS